MKSLFVLFFVSIVIMFSSCSKGSPEEQCKKGMEKVLSLMMEDPMMKQMPKEALDKMKAQMGGEESIKKCVADFKQEMMDCLMKASNLTDAQKCK